MSRLGFNTTFVGGEDQASIWSQPFPAQLTEVALDDSVLVVPFTGTTTEGSPVIATTATGSLNIGMVVAGTGVPTTSPPAIITAIDSGVSVTISDVTTASGAASLTAAYYFYAFIEQVWDPTYGTYVPVDGGRTGTTSYQPAIEINNNNLETTLPRYVSLRYRSFPNGMAIFEFQVDTPSLDTATDSAIGWWQEGLAFTTPASKGSSSASSFLTTGCVVAASCNQTLSGVPDSAIDGVTMLAGYRVLLTNQTTASQNGPWIISAGAWTRPPEYASGNTAYPGYVEGVAFGEAYKNTTWAMQSGSPGSPATAIIVDTDATTWTLVEKVDGLLTGWIGLDGAGNKIYAWIQDVPQIMGTWADKVDCPLQGTIYQINSTDFTNSSAYFMRTESATWTVDELLNSAIYAYNIVESTSYNLSGSIPSSITEDTSTGLYKVEFSPGNTSSSTPSSIALYFANNPAWEKNNTDFLSSDIRSYHRNITLYRGYPNAAQPYQEWWFEIPVPAAPIFDTLTASYKVCVGTSTGNMSCLTETTGQLNLNQGGNVYPLGLSVSNESGAITYGVNDINFLNETGGITFVQDISTASQVNVYLVAFTSATPSTDGIIGAVPAPSAGEQNSLLGGDAAFHALGAFNTTDSSTTTATVQPFLSMNFDEDDFLVGPGTSIPTRANVQLRHSLVATCTPYTSTTTGSVTPAYSIEPDSGFFTGGPAATEATAFQFTFKDEDAHYVLIGPTSGSAAKPSFRALTTADILAALTTGITGWSSSGGASQMLMNVGGELQWVDTAECP